MRGHRIYYNIVRASSTLLYKDLWGVDEEDARRRFKEKFPDEHVVAREAEELPLISRFFGDYRFLSNFWYVPVEYNGEVWATSEHAYMSAKSHDPSYKRNIKSARTPGRAKMIGKLVALRSDWEDVKDAVMLSVLEAKFSKRVAGNVAIRKKLLSTGRSILVEGNDHGDRYWGVCKGEGENRLGELLMRVREKVAKEDRR